MNTRGVAAVAIFSAAAIGTNYAMYPLPNVKLMDMLVFVAAFCFGLPVGASVATVSWLVYGSLNPLGPAGFPLILVLAAAESVYAVFGAGLRRASVLYPSYVPKRPFGRQAVYFAAAGGASALIYDLATNAFTGLLAYSNRGPWEAMLLGLLTMNFPVPLGLMHEVSNILFFAAVAPPVVAGVQRVLGGRLS